MADQRAAEGALKQGFAAVESTKADIDSLGGEPTIADVNALLNSHPKVKNLELEKRDEDKTRDARTYTQIRDNIDDDGYTPANYTRRR